MYNNINKYFIILGLLFLFSCYNKQADKKQKKSISKIERIEFTDKNGNRHYQGMLIDGKKEGLWITYNDSTFQVQEIQNYIDNVKNGVYVYFKPDKTLGWIGNYENGERNKHWIGFQKNNLLRSDTYVGETHIGRRYDDNGFLFEEYDFKTHKILRKYKITKLEKYTGWTTQ